MASHSGRTNIHGVPVRRNGMCFFRIILPHNLEDENLRLPETFVRAHGKCLPNPVKLRLPNGTIWTVKWTTCKRDIWFEEGWREFAEYLSLEFGHFLLFKYEGSCHFDVMVFDWSTTEVEYPSNLGNNSDETNMAQETEYQNTYVDVVESDDDSVVFLGESKVPPEENGVEQKGTPPTVELNQKSKRHKKMQTLTSCRKKRLLERAGKGFKPKHPFFMVPMQPSFISIKFRLRIPWKSAKGHFDVLQSNRSLILQSTDGRRSWAAKCYIRKRYKKAELVIGWKEFASDNHLQVGDVCIFVLVERSKRTYQVFIHRASRADHGNCSISEGEAHLGNRKRSLDDETYQLDENGCHRNQIFSGHACSPSERNEDEPETDAMQGDELKSLTSEGRYPVHSHSYKAFVASQKFISKIENPYFMVSIQLTHLNNSVTPTVPKDFLKTYGKQNVRLQVGKKWWILRLVDERKSAFKFSGGWPAFVEENDLQVGDICVFVLMHRGESTVTMKVSIFRRTVQSLAAYALV